MLGSEVHEQQRSLLNLIRHEVSALKANIKCQVYTKLSNEKNCSDYKFFNLIHH